MNRVTATEPRWPNLFVVGAAKAGTTSLWRYLGEHPEIFMCPVKEPRFFSSHRALESQAEAEAYLALFEGAGDAKLRGEASPGYLTRSGAARAICERSPEARIVISLREPVERTHSSYLSLVSDGVEQRSFHDAVADELAGRRLERLPSYVKPRLYSRGIRRYRRNFPDCVFILFFEELTKQPAVVMRDLYAFLDVDPVFAERFERPKAHNQFKVPRNRAVGQLFRARRLARTVLPERARDRVAAATTKSADKPRPDPESVQRLCDFYRAEVEAVRRQVGRPLPTAWDKRFPVPPAAAPVSAARPES